MESFCKVEIEDDFANIISSDNYYCIICKCNIEILDSSSFKNVYKDFTLRTITQLLEVICQVLDQPSYELNICVSISLKL